MKLAKTGTPGYMYDMDSGAFINSDSDEYSRFINERKQTRLIKDLLNRIENLEQRVMSLEAGNNG